MKAVYLLAGSIMSLALAMPAAAQEGPPQNGARNGGTLQGAAQTGTDEERTEDVIVTAQKRDQTLIEVPQSISVVSGETLERQQARSFLDYAQLVPGLNVTQDNPGQSRLTLRGINTGSPGSTVAVYVDDAPFGASGSLSNGAVLAGDFDTFDVARIEVLRGPQGTLYGANSLGGVLKFVTVAPALGKFEARGQGGIETTEGGGTGYLGNLVVNLPVGDTLAVRGSGFYKKTAGYIDAIGLPKRNADKSDSYGGRASLLFQPTAEFSIRLLGVLQNIRVDAPSSFTADPFRLKPVDPITGASTGKNRLRYQRYPEFHDLDYRLYSGTLDYDFGFASLTSASSYSTQKLKQISDISTGIPGADGARGLASFIYSLPGNGGYANGTLGLGYQNDVDVKKFTQEVRLTSEKSDVFEYLIGGYYTHEKTRVFQRYLPFTLATQTFIPQAGVLPAGILGPDPVSFQEFVTAVIDAKYEEYAGFANATLHLGPRFDLTGGARYSHNKQSSSQVVNQLGTGTPVLGSSSEGVFTWSVSPRFEFTPRAAVYARVAKGYRPGGPNFIPPGAGPGFPAEFNSDTLISYETGLKAETNDGKFGLDVAGFYVDWKNILILTAVDVAGNQVGVNTNGRRARSYGAEATATIRPTVGLSFAATFNYNRAYLRDDTTPAAGVPNVTGGLAGDDLPFTPRYTAGLSGDYTWSIGSDVRAYVGGNVRLQSDQKAGFDPDYRTDFGRQITLDGYQTVDLRAGVDIGAFTIQAYARNVFDNYGLINAGGYPYAIGKTAGIGGLGVKEILASSIRPRTIGGTVGFKF